MERGRKHDLEMTEWKSGHYVCEKGCDETRRTNKEVKENG